MDKRYKIILSSNNLYKEIELAQDAQRVKVGTSLDCDIRLRKDLFFGNVELFFVKNEDKWSIHCSDNLYLTVGDIRKLMTKNLVHGDSLEVKYQESDNYVFSLDFLIDFNDSKKEYDRVIDLSGISSLTIGCASSNNIALNSPFVKNDALVLSKKGTSFVVDIKQTTYGVYINGKKAQTKEELRDGDFLSISDFFFYYKSDELWAQKHNGMKINSLHYVDKPVLRSYPKFNRNTRINAKVPVEPIFILDPPEKPEKSKENILLTLLPSVAMLILTVVLRGFMGGSGSMTFVIFSACTMGMGIITSIITFLKGRKDFKKAEAERIASYQKYINEKCAFVDKVRGEERDILNNVYPNLEELVKLVKDYSGDLFDRLPTDEDFLHVRLGSGRTKAQRKIEYKAQERFESDDELTYYPQQVKEKYDYIENTPVTIDLRNANAVGFIGDERSLYCMAKNIALDVAIRQFFDDVKFVFIMNEEQIIDFDWIRFIPHIQTQDTILRNISYNGDSRTALFEKLYNEFTWRLEHNKSEFEHLVIFVLDSGKIMSHPLSKFIKHAAEIRVSFVFFEREKEKLPLWCANIIRVTNGVGEVINATDGTIRTEFRYEDIQDDILRYVANRLAPIYCEKVSLEGSLRKTISLFELLNIYSVDDLDLTKRWASTQVYKSMAAPLGVKTKDEVVSLDIHEKAHGPHGLVAGTTGSGKSEILQSYILSMATLYHPYEVGFVIIDFKGGGMANQFKDLPHLVGTITNIDGKQINRSLLSIKAELLKRQNAFATADVNHIDKYIKKFKKGEVSEPLPHLIIIVDEFAELKAEQPEFMKELISTARIGRSLGVHLILATQKPSGQVNEQIWSNSRFKLCLKVQSQEDSNEMIKSPLAAEILEPGRAYFQVGNNEIFDLFQSGYSGMPEKADLDASKVNEFVINEIDFSGKRSTVFSQKQTDQASGDRTQLEAIVDYVNQYCQNEMIERLQSICLPPLPEILVFPENTIKKEGYDIIVDIGLLDDPNRQVQITTSLNLAQENTIIIGSTQSGKTNLLQTIIKGIATNYSPSEVNIYILDFASMVLKSFDNLCHVGGVVTSAEDEKFKNLFKLLFAEISMRKEKLMKLGLSSCSSYRETGKTDMPQIVLMVDNFTAVKEYYLQEDDPLMQICREGLSVGISVIISNSQTAGLGYRYMANFSKRIALYCNESNEYSSVIEKCRIAPDNVAGRALTEINKEIFEIQTFLSFEGEKEIDRVASMREFVADCNGKYTERARRIPEIPDILHEKTFVDEYKINRKNTYTIPVGLLYDTISVKSIDLLKQGSFAVIGRPGAGKKNLLKVIFNQLYSNLFTCPSDVYIIDGVEKQLSEFSALGIVKDYTIDSADLINLVDDLHKELKQRYEDVTKCDVNLAEESLKLVVIQNADAVISLCKNANALAHYKELTGKYSSMKICFIFMDVENTSIGYSAPEIYKSIKENKNFFFFDDLQNIKVCDISAITLRKFKKKITIGDCYWLSGNEIEKIKVVKG